MGLTNGITVWRLAPYSLGFDWKAFRDMIGYGWKSYYASLMAFLIIRSDILFLNAFRGEAETGIYRQVVYVSDLVYLVPMTLGTLLFPKLMQNGASSEIGEDDRARFTMLVARLVAFLMLLFWILFALIGRWFLGIFGPEFPAGYLPLIILLGGILMLGIESILAAELARRGLPIFVVVYSTICMLVKIVGNVLLVPPYGMYGAAWSSLAAHFVFLAMVLWFCVRYYGFNVKDTLFVRLDDFRLMLERVINLGKE
jgi:O-antigen/teichoic acid export membrane protein